MCKKPSLPPISMPAISAGIFGFPKDRCAKILVSGAAEFLRSGASSLELVEFCIFDSEAFEHFRRELEALELDEKRT